MPVGLCRSLAGVVMLSSVSFYKARRIWQLQLETCSLEQLQLHKLMFLSSLSGTHTQHHQHKVDAAVVRMVKRSTLRASPAMLAKENKFRL